MNEFIDLSDTGLSDDELFTMTGQDLSAIEKIDAPKYSYWKSVWRVFFRKKSNIVIIILTLIILIFTYIYPMFSGFDKFQNIMDMESRHLSPSKAFQKFGVSIHWLFGTGGSGQSTFDDLARLYADQFRHRHFAGRGVGLFQTSRYRHE